MPSKEIETVSSVSCPHPDSAASNDHLRRADVHRDALGEKKEFWNMAQMVRQWLTHIWQKGLPMLMICDADDNKLDCDEVGNVSKYDASSSREEGLQKERFDEI